MRVPGQQSLAITLIETQVHDIKKELDGHVERIDKKFDRQSMLLGGIFLTTFIPALQSMGIHTAAWLPDAIKFMMGFI